MRHIHAVVVAVLILLVASVAWAGPTWISIELPPRPWRKGDRAALFVVRAPHIGEHKGQLTAHAEGRVDGKRRSIPLTLDALEDKDAWAVSRQWPLRGKWVLVFRATGHVASTAVVDLRNATIKKERFGPYTMGRERFGGAQYWHYDGLSLWSQVGELSDRKIEQMLAAGAISTAAPPGFLGPPLMIGVLLLGILGGGSAFWRRRRPETKTSVNALGPVAS